MLAATAQSYIIETEGLTKHYGSVVAVDNLSLRITGGGVFGLLGPNGSGKTTTMSMLLGLVKPTRGSISLFARNVNGSHDEALRRIGAIVENPAFYPHLSGRGNLRFFQGMSRAEGPYDVDRLLGMVELSSRADSPYRTYSMGMKQRLGIAYTLLGNPELVFLDEPTNGLDPAGMAEVRGLIKRLGSDGRTVILSSHLLHEVEQVCDQVAILSRGRLIAQGRVQDLLRRKGSIVLKTTDNARARSIIAALDWVSGVSEDNGNLVADASPERSGELTRALARQDVFVTAMTPGQASLESYFLEVTGKDADSEPKEARP